MKPSIFAMAVVSAFAMTAVPAVSNPAEGDGAQARINLSGKLRMLSQRIPSAACHLASGVDSESAAALLTGASAEFEQILAGLEFGDDGLKIYGAEERRKTLAVIRDLRNQWEPMKAAAVSMASGDVSDSNVQTILNQNMVVLGTAKLLVSELVAQYSNPTEMLQADSMLIDIAGRQRMLTQKISKESCMMTAGFASADTKSDLEGTIQTFEVSLAALSEGMKEAGINPPPSHQIREGLRHVKMEYDLAKPTLDAILSGQNASGEDQTSKFQVLNTTMKKMNDVVIMYTNTLRAGS
ncbi:MAG: type IV pili methyl-accepting chemotaxis transducer N-terminal domain-containing protein [Pseudomonadota bacterium]